jgi:hypothetical protein
VRLTQPVKLGAAALGAAALGVSAASAVVGGQRSPAPPSQVPVTGSERIDPIVPDPTGGLDWALRVYMSTSGASCAEVGRLSGGRFGQNDASGVFYPLEFDEGAVCGDLAVEPLVAAVNAYPAGAQRPARTVLFGRAAPAVADVLVQRRDVSSEAHPRIGAGGGFLLPLAGTLAARALPLTITFDDGRTAVYDWKGVRHNLAPDDS